MVERKLKLKYKTTLFIYLVFTCELLFCGINDHTTGLPLDTLVKNSDSIYNSDLNYSEVTTNSRDGDKVETYNYTGNIQTFTVPNNVFELQKDLLLSFAHPNQLDQHQDFFLLSNNLLR